MPNENTSDAGPASRPSTCSGDMYASVPNRTPGDVALAVTASAVRRGCARVPCESKVEDLDSPIAGEEEVLGLEVAMDDAPAVGGGESLGCLERDRQDVLMRRCGREITPRNVSPSSSSVTRYGVRHRCRRRGQ